MNAYQIQPSDKRWAIFLNKEHIEHMNDQSLYTGWKAHIILDPKHNYIGILKKCREILQKYGFSFKIDLLRNVLENGSRAVTIYEPQLINNYDEKFHEIQKMLNEEKIETPDFQAVSNKIQIKIISNELPNFSYRNDKNKYNGPFKEEWSKDLHNPFNSIIKKNELDLFLNFKDDIENNNFFSGKTTNFFSTTSRPSGIEDIHLILKKICSAYEKFFQIKDILREKSSNHSFIRKKEVQDFYDKWNYSFQSLKDSKDIFLKKY